MLPDTKRPLLSVAILTTLLFSTGLALNGCLIHEDRDRDHDRHWHDDHWHDHDYHHDDRY